MEPVVVTANEEAIEAWDGPLYERFVRFRHLLADGLGVHGDEALRAVAPAQGERALDIGCGFGDTAQQLAELVGPDGSVLGVDAAPRFIETAREEAARAGVRNARFEVVDVEAHSFDEQFDLAFSRMGTMFFANPVAALRNVRKALVPGGRLAMAVWRSKVENDCFYRGQLVTERFVTKPEQYDEPTCGPGPFSMGNADTTSGILVSAGFERISLLRCDKPILIGVGLDEAVEFVMSIGPAGEILRLAGEQAEHLHEPVAAALRDDMAEWVAPDGRVMAPASTWIVTAQAPTAP
ncbi:MAG TPA: class I SAM-dependent methyltransferase [Solirubrobacteraceae bacterium]|nr:class I SAM-dependent methyltransferase [Solirubrobacteraceae bacterium]